MEYFLKKLVAITLLISFAGPSLSQSNPKGEAISYPGSYSEIPESARPNDATVSLYEDRRRSFIQNSIQRDNAYQIDPKGNAIEFDFETNPKSEALEKELSNGYILSYIYYDNGVIKYNGMPVDGRFEININDKTLFFTHSTGKSIVSYILAHAVCDGYINSADEIIDWPMMSDTLYHDQPLRNLLNMSAGDRHTVNDRASHVMGSSLHHRDMGVDTIAALLKGTSSRGNEVFYNNVLTDIIANYVAFKAGSNYDDLLKKVFQDNVKIKEKVFFEKHKKTLTNGALSLYYGQMQTRASYSFFITRMDLLRVALAMMKDYQSQTCVGRYLRDAQRQARAWNKFRPGNYNAELWLHNYAKKYGAQFYFDFHDMSERNILATEGYNGQNIMIDLDKSRILVVNSAATGWDQRTFMLNVIKYGALPK